MSHELGFWTIMDGQTAVFICDVWNLDHVHTSWMNKLQLFVFDVWSLDHVHTLSSSFKWIFILFCILEYLEII